MSNNDIVRIVVFGICIGILLTSFILMICPSLSKDTANEICFNLTGVNGIEGKVSIQGKLICETPSFDSTQNIIIKYNKNE